MMSAALGSATDAGRLPTRARQVTGGRRRVVTHQRRACGEADAAVPNSARVDDYLLGGGYNFASDRELAAQLAAAAPGARDVALLNRVFLRRTVLFLVNAGIRQFLDLGSGISTVENVHEIAQRANHQARVVYVAKEPIAVAHTRILLTGNPRARVVRAEFCEPEAVLHAAETCQLLDFNTPIGLLAVSVLQWVPDRQRPHGIIASYRDRLAAGSYLVLSHCTADTEPERMAATVEVFKRHAYELHPRSRKEILGMFSGFELVDPGLVTTAGWHPDPFPRPRPSAERPEILAGVGRKP